MSTGPGRTPPRFVPTLTEVVQSSPSAVPAPPVASKALEEQIVQRVLQRVDLTLDRRLREAIATLVLEQTQALGPVLRARLDAMVREAVAEALAQERAARPPGR